ncbi:hypothetical protein ACHHYP_12090 [Achlya hypogyna]|uniref:Uncharacterized protein n=1 Tax=Achlya hypogyna TaxID=1202772 RepID=A0A1V9YHM0_ACHHY|nr:hypothetical protein ACHHYP_12090 [Achlya hypogyna]
MVASKPRFRNAYQRKMQRIYRQAMTNERLALRAHIASLEAEAKCRMSPLQTITSPLTTMLSWADVALALQEEVSAAKLENQQLRTRVQQCRDLILRLELAGVHYR